MALRNSTPNQQQDLPPDVAAAASAVSAAANIGGSSGTYFLVMRRTADGMRTEMLQPFFGTAAEEKELVRKLQLHLANFRKRQRKTTPIVVRRVEEGSPFFGVLAAGDYYESVADFNEDMSRDRADTTTHRAIQRALHRGAVANIEGVHVSFADAAEVARAEAALSRA